MQPAPAAAISRRHVATLAEAAVFLVMLCGLAWACVALNGALSRAAVLAVTAVLAWRQRWGYCVVLFITVASEPLKLFEPVAWHYGGPAGMAYELVLVASLAGLLLRKAGRATTLAALRNAAPFVPVVLWGVGLAMVWAMQGAFSTDSQTVALWRAAATWFLVPVAAAAWQNHTCRTELALGILGVVSVEFGLMLHYFFTGNDAIERLFGLPYGFPEVYQGAGVLRPIARISVSGMLALWVALSGASGAKKWHQMLRPLLVTLALPGIVLEGGRAWLPVALLPALTAFYSAVRRRLPSDYTERKWPFRAGVAGALLLLIATLALLPRTREALNALASGTLPTSVAVRLTDAQPALKALQGHWLTGLGPYRQAGALYSVDFGALNFVLVFGVIGLALLWSGGAIFVWKRARRMPAWWIAAAIGMAIAYAFTLDFVLSLPMFVGLAACWAALAPTAAPPAPSPSALPQQTGKPA